VTNFRKLGPPLAASVGNPYSRVTLAVVGTLVVLGLAAGIVAWQTAPAECPANEPANNAVVVHWVLAGVAVVATLAAYGVARRRGRAQVLSLPFRAHALRRVRATLRLRPFTALGLLRTVVALPLLYVLLWEPFRAAMQVCAALAPSWTANAWGGPTYVGASMAHWLDGYLLFYVSALLLHVVLVQPDAHGRG